MLTPLICDHLACVNQSGGFFHISFLFWGLLAADADLHSDPEKIFLFLLLLQRKSGEISLVGSRKELLRLGGSRATIHSAQFSRDGSFGRVFVEDHAPAVRVGAKPGESFCFLGRWSGYTRVDIRCAYISTEVQCQHRVWCGLAV